jgi:hydroxyacylglutathione hydrolase
MYRALVEVLGALPSETRVFCGHEYTESNLRFALHVDGDNPQVSARMDRVREARARGESTVPSILSEEWETNPFMRADHSALQQAASAHGVEDTNDPVAVLGALREMKNRF